MTWQNEYIPQITICSRVLALVSPAVGEPWISDVNKDLTFKAKDKDKDQTLKAKDQDIGPDTQGQGQGPDLQGQGQGLGQL